MPDIYSRFTSEALYTMRRAREMLDEHKGSQIWPEHLLLAILELSRSDCARVLDSVGVDAKRLKQALTDRQEEWLAAKEDNGGSSVRSYMSRTVRKVQDAAMLQAAHEQVFGITTRHLLSGILSETDGVAHELLTAQNVTLDSVHNYSDASIEQAGDKPEQIVTGNPFKISPVFWGIVAATAVAGFASYYTFMWEGPFVFLFVLGGWLISLALHEYGHALAAYYAGDRSVASKGYLTLNPLKYTHWLLSIALPLVFIIIYGIGLPGGAVYIDRTAIRDQRMNSMISAAGPLASLLFTLLLAIPFFFGWVSEYEFARHPQFWSGVAFLLMLEVMVLLFNLIPIPGLDGYGIIEQFLPENMQASLQPVKTFGFFILFFVFFQIPAFSEGFWDLARTMTDGLNVSREWIGNGIYFFRFWSM